MMRLMPALLWIAVLGLAHEPLGRAAADQAKAAALKNPSSPMKHERAVLAVAFSPKGKRLASGSSDARIQLLDLSAPGQPAMVPVTLPSPTPKPEHQASGQDAEQPSLAVVEKISGFVGFYTDAGRRVGEAKVGKLPHEAVLAPDGRLLYVSDNGGQHPVLRDYEVQGKGPHMLSFGPDGDWAFVSNVDSNTVAAIHLPTGRVNLMVTGGRPQGSVLAPDGDRLYVVNTGGDAVTI